MSIIIRGMAMPGNCSNCFFCDDWAKCQLLNLNNIFDYCKDGIERPAKCPLLPLPERHGRLGDLDRLFEVMGQDADRWIVDEVSMIETDDVLDAIQNAPTIVPAEGGEEA